MPSCVPTVYLMFGLSPLILSSESLPGSCHHFYSQSHTLPSRKKPQFEVLSSPPHSPLHPFTTPRSLQTLGPTPGTGPESACDSPTEESDQGDTRWQERLQNCTVMENTATPPPPRDEAASGGPIPSLSAAQPMGEASVFPDGTGQLGEFPGDGRPLQPDRGAAGQRRGRCWG